jgi:S1-C subfamily serine protease
VQEGLSEDSERDLEARTQLNENVRAYRDAAAEEGHNLQHAGKPTLHAGNAHSVSGWTFDLEAGSTAVIIGACDHACGDLDLSILDPKGTLVSEDIEPDTFPVVTFTPRESGRYLFRALMVSCHRNPCHYGIQLLTALPTEAPDLGTPLSHVVGSLEVAAKEHGLSLHPAYDPEFLSMDANAVQDYDLPLERDDAVIVVAICDDRCTDLDLAIDGPDGSRVAVDVEDDATPSVFFEASAPGTYELKVGLAECAGRGCHVAFQVFRIEAAEAPEEFGSGTCFAVRPDGLLLTAHHVVSNAKQISVRLADGRQFVGQVSAHSPQNDLATLSIPASTPDFLNLASGGSTRLGERIFTIGFPIAVALNASPTFSEGTVGGMTGFNGEANSLQISVPVQPGNSGGPVVNAYGEVLGVVAAKTGDGWFYEQTGTLPQNLNWAVKAEYARPLFEQPAPQLPASTRSAAIARASRAVCYVETVGGGGASPASISGR